MTGLKGSLIGACACLIAGCAGINATAVPDRVASEPPIVEVGTPAELPTIPEHFRTRFSQLRPEMPLSEFRTLFPEAYFVKRLRVRWLDHPIDAYELLLRQRYQFPREAQVYVKVEAAWFYFAGAGLESWGDPEAWPAAPQEK